MVKKLGGEEEFHGKRYLHIAECASHGESNLLRPASVDEYSLSELTSTNLSDTTSCLPPTTST